MNEHNCHSEDDLRIIERPDDNPYWIIEWGYEDGNDPCFGTIIISYCPFCGEKLDAKK